jgi:hypothetical protein
MSLDRESGWSADYRSNCGMETSRPAHYIVAVASEPAAASTLGKLHGQSIQQDVAVAILATA